MYNETRTFSTSSRHLENFLWMHKIHFVSESKGEDMMHQWTYERTPRFNEVLTEYKSLYSDTNLRTKRRFTDEEDVTE